MPVDIIISTQVIYVPKLSEYCNIETALRTRNKNKENDYLLFHIYYVLLRLKMNNCFLPIGHQQT